MLTYVFFELESAYITLSKGNKEMNNPEFNTFNEAVANGYMRIGYPRVVEKYRDHNIVIADISGENAYGYKYGLIVGDKVFCESVRVWANDEINKAGHWGSFLPMFFKPAYDKGLEQARKYIDAQK